MPNRFKLYYLSNLKDSFTANWIGASGKQSESKPIFILSSGRCGSTLLSSFLNTHEDVFIPKENTLILDIIKQWHSNPFESWEKKVSRLVENVRSTHNWKIDIDGLKEILLKTVPAKQNLNQLCDTLFSLSAKAFDKSATVWGDQTPANGTYMKTMKAQFPESRIIFLVRDPRAVCASYFKINKEFYSEKFVLWRWQNTFLKYIHIKAKYPDSIGQVKYEDLVANFDSTIGDLLKWLKLDASKFDLSQRAKLNEIIIEGNSAAHENVGNAVNTDSIRKWEKELSAEQIKRIEQQLGSSMNLYK